MSKTDKIRLGLQCILLCVFSIYLVLWFSDYKDYLFNPGFQNDDARTILFPMHHYDHPPQLVDDPLAQAYSKSNPPVFKLVYQVLMNSMDLLHAAKVVQFLALSLIFIAVGWMIYVQPRQWEIALLYLFLILHTPTVMDRMAGGLVRSFGFPSLFVWGAGWLTNSFLLRLAGAVIAALLYPSTMLMIMTAELFLAILHWFKKLSWKKEFCVFVVCLLLYVPFMFIFGSLGHVFTLEEAMKNPAFGHNGLLGFTDAIPFLDPFPVFMSHFLKPLSIDMMSLSSGGNLIWSALILVLILGFAFKQKKAVWVPVFMIACFVLYAAGRQWAFKLYSPERFFNFGMVASGIFWVLSVFKGIDAAGQRQALYRTVSVILMVSLLIIFGGKGTEAKTSVTINNEDKKELFSFVSSLPSTVMIAAHPEDADDLPFWAARSSMGGYERTFLLIVELFEKRSQEIEQMLASFYADDLMLIEKFNNQYGITHWLIRKDFFEEDYQEKSRQGEPFGSFVAKLLEGKKLEQMVFRSPDKNAIVFEDENYILLDMKRWKGLDEH